MTRDEAFRVAVKSVPPVQGGRKSLYELIDILAALGVLKLDAVPPQKETSDREQR